MAEESQDGQERSEQATPKRLEDARKKGQIARSRELTTVMVLFAGALSLYLSGEHLFGGLADILRESFSLSKENIFEPAYMAIAFQLTAIKALIALTPFIIVMVLVALFAPMAIGGWGFSGQALTPKLDRLDPIKGMKRVFGLKGLVEMTKAMLKFVLVLGFALIALKVNSQVIIGLGQSGLVPGLHQAGDILFQIFLFITLATLIVALLDVPYQLWDHGRNLKMTLREIKDELKETDGSPELKSRIRQLQQEIAARRMMEEVPNADVVITNPEHFAVALKFDPDSMSAPLLLAKGQDLVAQRIRELAISCDITIFSAPPLARAIYRSTKLNQEIPHGLYLAVAQVLAYVFQLKRASSTLRPRRPQNLPVPAEFEA